MERSALELNGETEFVPDPCGFDFWLSHTICTGSATNAPTDTPTTDAPSNAPTNVPTAATNVPTDTPTTDAPTNAPTNTPTDLPTTLPTSIPTDSPESNVCVDDVDFYLRKNQPNKNSWIADKKEKRCKKKNDSGTVESFCPSICNPRCTCKNKKGKITVKGKNKKLSCKQIEKKDLCESGVTENEEKVSHLCASACDTCYN
eukprot:CAMPEP_0170840008 /NCGR_PEP_ID=MMETSP0734-20130129/4314_1 /TAXON_ID=186038 /ORGANISM="Fragilariopsis kerguelensis, Strain L26-C5" /LENGTH=201 /DNA_ID=CAMNT_0011207719 /DNA_START=369 /DNA_END=973 /DNA_ORIENTATION=-